MKLDGLSIDACFSGGWLTCAAAAYRLSGSGYLLLLGYIAVASMIDAVVLHGSASAKLGRAALLLCPCRGLAARWGWVLSGCIKRDVVGT